MNNNIGLKSFTCYFCNKVIKNETEQGHRSTCGALLEPCPYKCGAYISRNLRSRHITECPNKPMQPSNSLSRKTTSNKQNTIDRRSQRYSMDIGPYVDNSNQEEIHSMKNKIAGLDQLCKNLSRNLSLIQTKNDETNRSNQTSHIQNKLEIEKVIYLTQTMTEWKNLVQTQIENIRLQLNSVDTMKRELEGNMRSVKQKLGNVDIFQRELVEFKDNFVKEQIYNREAHTDFQEKVREMKDYFVQENAVAGAVWNDHKIQIDNLRERFNGFEKLMEQQKAKIATLVFDVRAVMGISSECSDKLELQDRSLNDIKNQISQLRFDMEVLEESTTVSSLQNRPGHLLWKLTNFNAKLENAKENNSVLKSPLFYSHSYGYKIRLLVYLNGIKKWKGRHMIACIHVLNGEYDPLLKWPCRIEGNIIVRDIQDHNNPKDYSKFIIAKRNSGDEENEDPHESSTQYIFIPHTTLTKSNYLKDDTLFLEVKINEVNREKHETPL